MAADFDNWPDMVSTVFSVGVLSLFCVTRHWEEALKKPQKHDESDPSLRWVLFPSLSYPSSGVTSAVLLLSLCPSHQTAERHFVIEALFSTKRHYLLKEHCRELRRAVTPSAFPAGLQLKLNDWRLHAGQRSWGHVTCHTAFLTSSITLKLDHSQQTGDTWEWINALCTAPSTQFMDITFYRDLYTHAVHYLPCPH